jgi:hypothetical protein
MQCNSLLHLASLVVTLITTLMRFACTRMRDKCIYDISQFSSSGGSEILRAVSGCEEYGLVDCALCISGRSRRFG